MSNLNEQIQKAIADSLPAATANELKKFIEKAEETERELNRANGSLELVKSERDNLLKEEIIHGDIIERKKSVEKREINADKRDREFELELMKAERKLMLSHETRMVDLITKVAGHPSVSVSSWADRPHFDPNTGYENGRDTKSETVTTTEGKE